MKKVIIIILFFITALAYAQQTDSIIDIRDGQQYKIVKISQQWWMQENLNASTYSNGDIIPIITNSSIWQEWGEFTPNAARCYYNNDSIMYSSIYGTLYNGWTINNQRNLCPIGWHVPTDAEWSELIDSLGGESVAGGKLKDTILWDSPNTGATSSSSFSAFPGGRRNDGGSFMAVGVGAYFRSSTEATTEQLWSYSLSNT